MTLIGIAFVIDALDRGGAERLLVSLANNLDPEKYQIHVITTHHYGDLVSDLRPYIQVHCLNRHHRLSISSMVTFANIIRANQIRIVHTHCHSSAYFVAIARFLLSLDFLHVMHDHYGPILESPWIQRLDRLLLRNLDLYIGVSKHLVLYATSQLGLPSNKCRYIPNGIEIPSSTNFIKTQDFTVVQVGAITPNKNHLMALRIAAQVSLAIPDCKWLIIGRFGKDRRYFELIQNEIHSLYLENTVLLLGEKSNVSEYMKLADVGVLTSVDEALPLALLEYMAYGLPVIVTDVGDCRQVVEKGGGGEVCSVKDEDLFAATLIKLAKNPALAMDWGEKNYINVSQYFSIYSMVIAIDQEYGKILGPANLENSNKHFTTKKTKDSKYRPGL